MILLYSHRQRLTDAAYLALINDHGEILVECDGAYEMNVHLSAMGLVLGARLPGCSTNIFALDPAPDLDLDLAEANAP